MKIFNCYIFIYKYRKNAMHVSDPCSANPCLGNQRCVTINSTSYECSACLPGWTGTDCGVNTNDCAALGSRCQNGATCYDKVDGIQCICPFGFAGRYCEVNENECAFDVCVNNSTCEDGNDMFFCRCQPGWIGDFCLDPAPSSSTTTSTTTTTTSTTTTTTTTPLISSNISVTPSTVSTGPTTESVSLLTSLQTTGN